MINLKKLTEWKLYLQEEHKINSQKTEEIRVK